MMIDIKIKLLPHGRMPQRMSDGAAGFDCFSPKDGMLGTLQRSTIALGFCLEIPPGWRAHVVSRSGMARDNGVVEYWGTIDSDYRGEISALLFNHSSTTYRWRANTRVCQLLFSEDPKIRFVESMELSPSLRGSGGFGSTDEPSSSTLKKCFMCGKPSILLIDGICRPCRSLSI